MKLFFFLLLFNLVSTFTFADNKYFIVLKNPLQLIAEESTKSLSSNQAVSIGALELSTQDVLKKKVFMQSGVNGVKLFQTLKSSAIQSLSLKSNSGNTSYETDEFSSGGYVYIIELEDDVVETFKEELEQLDDFIYFQPNYKYRTFTTPVNEGRFNNQETDLLLMEFVIDGDTPAWVSSTGSGVRVAVLDTGIYPQHVDFCGGDVTVNESTQVMDVSSCTALDVPYDFINGGTPSATDMNNNKLSVIGADYDDIDSAPFDKNGHGTHVAGIIGARVNTVGIGGSAYESTIIPIRVLAPYQNDSNELFSEGTSEWIIQGINYAVTNNANIINMSLGGQLDGGDDILLENAVNQAYSEGVLLVAAAGNDQLDFDDFNVAPAYYQNVMSVSSVSNTGVFASFYSNYGESLDVAAVGTSVYSAGINSASNWVYLTGTSMATPYVSALAALIVSKNNLNGGATLTPDDIRTIIRETASNSSSPTEKLGYGIINATNALDLVQNFEPDDPDTYPELYTNKVLCYPNPLYRNQTGSTNCSIIQSQSGSAEYSIYSRRGQRVYGGELSLSIPKSSFSWNGVDLNGQSLPNGVYQLVFKLTPSDGTSTPITYKHLVTLL